MCFCCLYFITKDYSYVILMETVILFFAECLLSIGLSAVPFKKCMMETKNFHYTVYIISLINFFTALIICIIYCKCEEKENNLLKKIILIINLILTVLIVGLGILLFYHEIIEILDCDTYISSEIANLINKTDGLTFWNIYGTYISNGAFCLLNFVSIFYCIIALLYVCTRTKNPSELLQHFDKKGREKRNNQNNRNVENRAVINSEIIQVRNVN